MATRISSPVVKPQVRDTQQPLTSISVAADGTVWAADGTSTLHQVVDGSVGSNNGWRQQGNLLTCELFGFEFQAPFFAILSPLSAASDGSVFAVAEYEEGVYQVYQFQPAPDGAGEWVALPASPTFPSPDLYSIAAGSRSDLWCWSWTSAGQEIQRFDKTTSQWVSVQRPSSSLQTICQVCVASDHSVWLSALPQSWAGQNVLFTYDDDTSAWVSMPAPQKQILCLAVGAEDWVWALDVSGNVYQYDAGASSWELISGPANAATDPILSWIAAGDDMTVWGGYTTDPRSAQGATVTLYRFDFAQQQWDAMPAPSWNPSDPNYVTMVTGTVGNGANIWGYACTRDLKTGYACEYVADTFVWQQVQNSGSVVADLAQISCGSATNIWALDTSNKVYAVQPGIGNTYQLAPRPGTFLSISAASDGSVWGVDSTRQFCSYNNSSGSWDPLPSPDSGTLSLVSAANASTIWGVDTTNNIIHQYDDKMWTEAPAVPDGCKDLSVGSDGSVWAINGANTVYLYVGSATGTPDPWIATAMQLQGISVGTMTNVWGIDLNGQAIDLTVDSPVLAEGMSRALPQHGGVGWDLESVFNEAQSTHLWIVNWAATLLNSYNTTTGPQIYNLVKPRQGRIFDDFHDPLCYGLYDADMNAAYNGPPLYGHPSWAWHFYDPDTGENWLGYSSATALTQGALYFNNSVTACRSYLHSRSPDDCQDAGYNLGLALHFFTDLTQPMHAGNFTALSSKPWPNYHGAFEGYVMEIMGNTTPQQINRTVTGTDPRPYLIAAARASKTNYYQQVLAPLKRSPYGYYGYLSGTTKKEIRAMAPAILKDAVNWAAQFLLAWMEAVNAPGA